MPPLDVKILKIISQVDRKSAVLSSTIKNKALRYRPIDVKMSKLAHLSTLTSFLLGWVASTDALTQLIFLGNVLQEVSVFIWDNFSTTWLVIPQTAILLSFPSHFWIY